MAVFRALMYVLYIGAHMYCTIRYIHTHSLEYSFHTHFFFSIIVYINLLRIPPTQSKKKPPRAFTRKKNNKKIKNKK